MNDFENDLKALRDALAPLDARCPLPNNLRGDNIMKSAEDTRQRTPAALRRGIALAAAAAIVCTAAFVSDKLNLFTRNDLTPLPTEPTLSEDEHALAPLSTYLELEQAFLRMQKEAKKNTGVDFNYGGFGIRKAAGVLPGAMPDGMVQEDSMTIAETMPAADPDDAASHGKTNTQVQGVDEADILKNDGSYFYYVNSSDNHLYILQALPADKMKVLSDMSIPGYRVGTELYVQGDRMALVYTEYPPGDDYCTSVQVYDISDRENPLKLKSFSQKGQMLSSRMQDGRVYLISTQYVGLDFKVFNGAIPEEKILPVVYEDGAEVMLPAEKIAILPDAEEPSYLVVSCIDLLGEKKESETSAILGAGSQVYCNTEALYVACQQYATNKKARVTMDQFVGMNEKTLIYRFDLLKNGKIKPGPHGEVPGTPLNQFSIDESGGYFRIATTGFDTSHTVNIVTVLDKDLKQVGSIGDIAPGERIQSVRFIGDTGYVVTFLQTDPLFVLDLSDPKNPKIVGELKLPGFSAYLHPWDATHLIGVGPDGDKNGTNGNLKVSLFDISDPTKPKEVDRAIVKNSWTDIQQNHKAFVVCAEKNLFGLPIGNGYRGGNAFYTFKVDGDTLKQALVLEDREGGNVLRGTYIGDTWYLFDWESVAAFGMDTGKEIKRVTF